MNRTIPNEFQAPAGREQELKPHQSSVSGAGETSVPASEVGQDPDYGHHEGHEDSSNEQHLHKDETKGGDLENNI